MPKLTGQSLRVGVGASHLSLLGLRGTTLTQLGQHVLGDGADALGEGLERLFADAAPAGQPVTFVLADERVRLWQVTPPSNARRRADLEAAAVLRYQALYGEPPTGWKISADWDAVQPFCAAALSLSLLATIETAAAAARLPVRAVQPQFIAVWNRHCASLPDGAWLGRLQDGGLTVGASAGGRLRALRGMALGADKHWLATQLAREAVRLDCAAPRQIYLSGAFDASWRGQAGTLDCQLVDQHARPAGWTSACALAASGSGA